MLSHLSYREASSGPAGRRKWLPKLERFLVGIGLLILGTYVGIRVHGMLFSALAVRSFKSQHLKLDEAKNNVPLAIKTPDFSLWSPERIKHYQESLTAAFSPTIAVLRIPRIRLEAPVLPDTDDLSLNRGVGLIQGTAKPGENGNVGIAGHRDGFFRDLKDVHQGDRIELIEAKRTETYVIDRVLIVQPEEISVLAPRAQPSITLVTCYPFYFVGSAPLRYIVQGTLLQHELENSLLRFGRSSSSEIFHNQALAFVPVAREVRSTQLLKQ